MSKVETTEVKDLIYDYILKRGKAVHINKNGRYKKQIRNRK